MTVLGLQHMLDAVEKRPPLQCPSVDYRILSGQDEIILSYDWFNEAVWCWDCRSLQSCMMWWLLNNELGRTWKQVAKVSFETGIDCKIVRRLWRPVRMSGVSSQTGISRMEPIQKRDRLNQHGSIQNPLHWRFIQVTLRASGFTSSCCRVHSSKTSCTQLWKEPRRQHVHMRRATDVCFRIMTCWNS